jgi:isopentenyldiphosphate isomerase
VCLQYNWIIEIILRICHLCSLYLGMKNNIIEEWFPVVDEEGNEISIASRSICHNGKSKLLHPVVHLHLLNGKGELYLQKRASTKDLLPGKWDTSIGGHISPGESVAEALKREAYEELRLNDFKYQIIRKYIWESPREKELVYSFKGSSEETPVINKEEIDEGRFWSLQEIKDNIGKNLFTPNFEHEFDMLFIMF